MDQPKLKNPTGKIIVLVLLIGILTALLYFCFFFRNNLRKLGYDNRAIYQMWYYRIDDEVDEMNHCLLYALESKDFDRENLDYYLLFNDEFDYTEQINRLAKKYSVDEIKTLQQYFEIDAIIDLSEEDTLPVETLKQLKEKGYENEDCLHLINALSTRSMESLLSISYLSQPDSYMYYLENGYSDEVIVHLYNQLGDERFNDFCHISYFSSLNTLVDNDDFSIYNLPRYLLYMQENNVDTAQAVKNVNASKDLAEENKINYSSYYNVQKEAVTELTDTALINKQHALSTDLIINDLTDLEGEYRGNNQPLRKDTATAFIAMADALKEELNLSIIAYNNYQTAEEIETIYNTLLSKSKNDAETVDKLASRTYYNEHQSGMATDIALKNDSCYNLKNSNAYSWLLEHGCEYGFIQRYPQGKQSITGYGFIAYHFRYVGVDAATFMNKYSYTLEEYSLLFN